MITYCIGSARGKRAYFKGDDYVVADNIEVLFCVSENGRNYFAIGDVPFAEFTVSQYLNYKRALCKEKPDEKIMRVFGLDPDRRVGSLSNVKMRALQILEKTCGKTDKPVVVNLDGTRYTPRLNRELKRLIGALGCCYVCVTDARFLRYASKAVKTLFFGKYVKRHAPRFYAAKRLAELIGAKRIAAF